MGDEEDGSVGIDDDRVVHETIDGETILIDLSTGTYFSLRGSGPRIWELLLATGSIPATVAALADEFPGHETLSDEVISFAQDLISRELLTTGPAAAVRPATPPAPEREPEAVFSA